MITEQRLLKVMIMTTKTTIRMIDKLQNNNTTSPQGDDDDKNKDNNEDD